MNSQAKKIVLSHGDKSTSEEDFIAALKEGNRIIFNICLLYTDRTKESIEDLYQEIAYNLWKAWPNFRNGSSTTTWIYRIALYTALSHIRRRRRSPEFIHLDESVYENLSNDDAISSYDKLFDLFDELNDEEKKLMTLYLDQRPTAEMALILGISDVAARKRLSRLINKLKNKSSHKNE